MSDSWIAWKPRIEDPSKFSPSSKTAWSNDETGTVKCCITPGRSQNRTSTISTPSSLMYFSSSSLFANIQSSLAGRGPFTVGPVAGWCRTWTVRRCIVVRNLRGGGFSTVSPVFRPCNNAPVPWRGSSPDQSLGETYPGERLGLPERGTGSVARWGRRILALLVDWFASHAGRQPDPGPQPVDRAGRRGVAPIVTLLVFLA